MLLQGPHTPDPWAPPILAHDLILKIIMYICLYLFTVCVEFLCLENKKKKNPSAYAVDTMPVIHKQSSILLSCQKCDLQ